MPLKIIYKSTAEPSNPSPYLNAKVQIGDRVGAVLDATDTVVRLFGFGTYQGNELNIEFGATNPKILLDDGNVVWGYQCWWGSEAKIKKLIGKRVVEMVPAPEQS